MIDLLTVEEAAEFLRISPLTLRAWVSQGKISFVKLGGRVLFQLEDLMALVHSSIVQARNSQ